MCPPDFESFSAYAAKARSETLNKLKRANLSEEKRTVVYSFGAAEGLLLDRLNPRWKDTYSSTCYQWIHSSGTDRFLLRAI